MTHQFILTEELNPFENILKGLIYCINRAYFFVDKLTGMLGVIILLPILAACTFSIWVILKFSNWRLEALTKKLFRELKMREPRAIMLSHHAIKNRRIEADEIINKIKPTSKIFLFNPVYGQIKNSRNIFRKAEERLHITAYPHLHQELDEKQKQLLRELSKDLEGIWEDDDFLISK
jgi:hypothetical protein